MHDFSVNRLTVFKCVSRDGMLYLMPLQNTLAAASAAAPVTVLTADRTFFATVSRVREVLIVARDKTNKLTKTELPAEETKHLQRQLDIQEGLK